jgi:hypothetical protein
MAYLQTEQPAKLATTANRPALLIEAKTSWYKRLWYVISNPFLYVFTGKIRY